MRKWFSRPRKKVVIAILVSFTFCVGAITGVWVGLKLEDKLNPPLSTLYLPPPLVGEGEITKKSGKIPLMFKNVFTSEAIINGSILGTFLIDTGASVTLISPEFAEKSKIRAEKTKITLQGIFGNSITVPYARLKSLRLGDAEVMNVPVVISKIHFEVDGIIGLNILGKYKLTIDPDTLLLELTPARKPLITPE